MVNNIIHRATVANNARGERKLTYETPLKAKLLITESHLKEKNWETTHTTLSKYTWSKKQSNIITKIK